MNTRIKKKKFKERYHVDKLNRNVSIKRSADVNFVLIRRVLHRMDKALFEGWEE